MCSDKVRAHHKTNNYREVSSMAIKIEAITVALENELRERDFYLAHSKKTADPVGKKMFQQIAADEDEHYRRLQAIHQELSRKGAWPETVASTIGSSDILKTFRQLARQTQQIPAASRDDIAAIKIAIEFETKGQSFYAKLGSDAETVPEKEFFKILASLEWEHLLTLQDSLLFFEHPQDWFAEHEKSQLEG
jgi:rubrerythrin